MSTRTDSNVTNMTVEKQNELFQKLLNDKMKSDLRSKRLRVKNQMLIEKAKAANIEVTDKEIDDYIANMK